MPLRTTGALTKGGRPCRPIRNQPPRALPHRPNLRHLKDQARDLVKAGTATSVTDAQLKIALLYGFPSWPKLKAYVESRDEIGQMKPALGTSDEVTGGNRALQLPVHTTEMYGAFSPDRSRLLTGGDGADPKVHIWDVETGRCLHELTGHKEPVAALGWSVDQQWIASGAFDQSIRLWDVRSGACLLSLEGHRPYVRSVAFGQSGEVLLSGGGDGVVRLWALPNGTPLQVFEGHTDGVYHAVLDASRSRALSGGRDWTIRLWDVRYRALLEDDRRRRRPMSRLACRRAALPFLCPRYPAVGRGDWRVPAQLPGPQRHDSVRGMEPRPSSYSVGLP